MTSEREGVRGLVAKWRRESEKMQLHPAGLAARRVCAVELESALAAGEVEQRARELLADAYAAAGFPESASDVRKGRINYGALERASLSAIASAMSQQPEARGVVDASILQEAGDVLEAVAISGVPLPNNWRWPLADELRGMAAALTEARNVR